MAIEHRDRHHGGPDLVMVSCPICGHTFGPQEKRSTHFYSEHTWEDLGL